jgi:dihydrofolate reductase
MKVSMIVACGKNGQIGLDNKLLWHIPEDFKMFKKLTSGHTIIMGRNTFESLPGILPKRQHLVITSKCMISDNPLLEFTNSLEDALEMVKDQDEVWIIGGALVYNEAIQEDIVDEYYLSQVNYDGPADTFLNHIDTTNYIVSEQEEFEEYITDKGKIIPSWSFKVYKRVKKN